MKVFANRLAGRICVFAAATVFSGGVILAAPADDGHSSAAPAAAHAAPAQPAIVDHPAPAEAPVARSAEPPRAAPTAASPQNRTAETARPANPVSGSAVNSSPVNGTEHHDDRDGHYRDRRNPNYGYYPLGSAFDYFYSGWNPYDSGYYNQPAYPLQPDQSNADEALPYDQSVNAITPAVVPSTPITPSPALDSAMLASPQWRDANAQVQIAQSEYDAAAARVLTQLRNQPAYQQALAKKEQDAQRVADLKAKHPDPTISRATTLASAKLDAAKQVTDMQEAALQADPQASAAKAKLDAAIAVRNEARQAVLASLPKSSQSSPR